MKHKRRNIILIIVIGIVVGISVSQTINTAQYFASFIERIAASFIVRGKDNGAPLHKAAQRGNVRKIRQLLENGADVDAKDQEGRTPLYLAATHGQGKALEILLKHDANVDGQNYEAGVTALFGAVLKNRVKSAKILIKYGADVNYRAATFPQNPLQQAVALGHVKTAKILLGSGANVNARDSNFGMTALYIATVSGNKKMVSLLTKNGADETIEDNYGQTPEQARAIMKLRKTHKLVKARDESELFDSNAIVQIVYLGTTKEGATYHTPNRVGFVIGEGSVVITAGHCLNDFMEDSKKGGLVKPQVVSRYYGDIFEAKILAVDKDADVAILQVAWNGHPALELATIEELKAAKEIIIAAYPPPKDEATKRKYYREVFMERLPVIKLDDSGESKAIVVGGGKFNGPGWSGSPMILPSSGKVAGVLASVNSKAFEVRRFLHVLMGCDVNSIRSLLQNNDIEIDNSGKNEMFERKNDAEQTFSLFIDCFEASFQEDYALALSKMKEVVCLRPQSVNAHLLLAFFAEIMNVKYKDAQAIKLVESSYKEALRLEPENFSANAGYANFFLANKRNSEAIVLLNKAVELEPDNLFVLLKLVRVIKKQDPHQAEVYARDLIEKYPANADCWFELSNVLAKTGKHDEEIKTARKCVSLSKDVPYQHRRRLADALTNTKLFGEAESNFKLLLEDHECAACWFAYAKLLIRLDRDGDAIKAIGKAESMNQGKVVSPESLVKLRSKLLKSNARIKAESEQ
jgi:tetratricopeptide (TPR) repeat protein